MDRVSVLVVDDEFEVRRAIVRVLTRAGLDVHDVDGPEAALAALRSGRRFDVMLTDLEMPGPDGRALLSETRSSYPDLPIVVMSGNIDPDTSEKDLGVSCLAKPFRHEDLIDAVTLAAAARATHVRIKLPRHEGAELPDEEGDLPRAVKL